MKILNIILPIAFVLFSCSKQTSSPDSIPDHVTFKMPSVQIGEDRVINVWTPKSYVNSADSLDVMYMADGGIQEDFPHIANTLEKLIQEKKIKPIILVGIENTQRRRDLSGPTEVEKDKEIAPVVGGSAKFRAFIKEELIPEIEKKYRTTKKRSIIGESLSGLFVMETFFLDPELFDNYIAFDPSLWWNNKYLVHTANEHLNKFPNSEKTLWFAGSNATDIFQSTRELAEILKQKNLKQLIWKYSDEPKEEHQTIFRSTKEKALIWTFNAKEEKSE